MIVSLHVATGAAGGALVRSRLAAVVVGAVLHAAGDRMPHQDIASRTFELVSGVSGLLAIAIRRGWLDAATIGGIAGSVPDLEHLFRLPRPGGRKLFPSHRIHGFHRAGGVSAGAQIFAAGLIFGLLIAPRRG